MAGKFFIKSYGCQMNVYDSYRMSCFFIENGWSATASPSEANVIILNTCSIREKADDKLFSDLGRIRRIKDAAIRAGNECIIAVTGCIAQINKDLNKFRGVDIILGPQMVQHIFDSVESLLQTPRGAREIISLTKFNGEEKFKKFPQYSSLSSVSAFVTIQEGCDNFCTYCIVPHTRGREYSRPINDVLQEVKELSVLGVKEIVLLGQNVNSYGGCDAFGHKKSLSYLIQKIADLEDIKTIRYTTSHPKDMTDDLIEVHQKVEKLAPFIHLPVQSGSESILEAMNRKYTPYEYKECIARIKDARSDIAFSSDFIVGFPGETDRDFQDTIDLVREVTFAQAYSFKYSPRSGTKSAIMDNQVDERVKEERLAELQNLLLEQQRQFNAKSVNQIVDVILHKKGSKKGQYVGKTPHGQAISIDNCDGYNIGDVVKVKVSSVLSHSLSGEIV